MDHLGLPIAILAACALTLLASLWFGLQLKREMAALRATMAHERETRQAAEAELRQAISRLEQELEEERKASLARAAPLQQSMNLSKRSQALRMHRLGEPPEKIARTLGLSRTEVDLLLKVHRTVLESAGLETARMRMEFTSAGAPGMDSRRPGSANGDHAAQADSA